MSVHGVTHPSANIPRAPLEATVPHRHRAVKVAAFGFLAIAVFAILNVRAGSPSRRGRGSDVDNGDESERASGQG